MVWVVELTRPANKNIKKQAGCIIAGPYDTQGEADTVKVNLEAQDNVEESEYKVKEEV